MEKDYLLGKKDVLLADGVVSLIFKGPLNEIYFFIRINLIRKIRLKLPKYLENL